MTDGCDVSHMSHVRATRIDIDELPDEVLTDRACDGDTRAFEALVRRYHAGMFALASRIVGSRQDGEDAVQLAFLAAWRALPRFRGEARFATWLYRIVANEALAQLRRRRPEQPLLSCAQLPGGQPGPERHAEHAALAAALAEALAAIPPDLRVAWLLREVEHCSYEEVACIVGTNLSTVRGRIARARAALAEALAAWR